MGLLCFLCGDGGGLVQTDPAAWSSKEAHIFSSASDFLQTRHRTSNQTCGLEPGLGIQVLHRALFVASLLHNSSLPGCCLPPSPLLLLLQPLPRREGRESRRRDLNQPTECAATSVEIIVIIFYFASSFSRACSTGSFSRRAVTFCYRQPWAATDPTVLDLELSTLDRSDVLHTSRRQQWGCTRGHTLICRKPSLASSLSSPRCSFFAVVFSSSTRVSLCSMQSPSHHCYLP